MRLKVPMPEKTSRVTLETILRAEIDNQTLQNKESAAHSNYKVMLERLQHVVEDKENDPLPWTLSHVRVEYDRYVEAKKASSRAYLRLNTLMARARLESGIVHPWIEDYYRAASPIPEDSPEESRYWDLLQDSFEEARQCEWDRQNAEDEEDQDFAPPENDPT